MRRPFFVIGLTMLASLIFISLTWYKCAFVLIAVSLFLLPIFIAVKSLRKQGVYITVTVTVLMSAVLFVSFYFLTILPQQNYAGKKLNISGIVYELPETKYNKQQIIIKADKVNGEKIKRPFKISFSSEEITEARPYDRISVYGKVYELGDNYTSKLQHRSKGCILGVWTNESVLIKNENQNKPLRFFILQYRQKLINSLFKLLPRDNAALCAAVLTGDTSYINSSDYKDITDIGISHLVCVSGLHLSIFCFGLLRLTKKLYLSRIPSHIAVILFTVFMMALCGFTSSVVRAGIMFILFLISELIWAEPDGLNSLGIATFIILLNPFNAGNIGFIFSFCACAAILTFGNTVSRRLKEKYLPDKPKKIQKWGFSLLEILIVSVFVNLFSLPAYIFVFKKITFFGIISNVLILPFASVILICTALTAVLGLIPLSFVSVITYPFACIASYFSAYIILIARTLSKLPFINVYAGEKYVFIFLGIAFLTIAAAVFVKRKKQFIKVACVVFCLCFISASAFNAFLSFNKCVICTYSLGTDTSFSIRSGNEFILINCGGNFKTLNKVEKELNKSLSDDIDLLVLTDKNSNYTSSFSAVKDSCKIKNIVVSDENSAKIKSENLNSKIICDNYGSYSPSANFTVTYAFGKESAVSINFNDIKVLYLTSPKIEISSLPEEMQSFNFLILNGKPNNNIVKSNVSAIIEICNKNKYLSENKVLIKAGYSVYETGNETDINIIIEKNKAYVRRESLWGI